MLRSHGKTYNLCLCKQVNNPCILLTEILSQINNSIATISATHFEARGMIITALQYNMKKTSCSWQNFSKMNNKLYG